ncbi:unnamed protein product, partial [Prorocentrum cordatum]
ATRQGLRPRRPVGDREPGTTVAAGAQRGHKAERAAGQARRRPGDRARATWARTARLAPEKPGPPRAPARRARSAPAAVATRRLR